MWAALAISVPEITAAENALKATELAMQRRQSEPQTRIPANPESAMRLRTPLWAWFFCGLAALLIFPPLRGSDPLFGWLPFWLVVAPLIDLAVLRRGWLAATSRAFLVRSRGRRRLAPRQARLLSRRHGRVGRQQQLQTALFSGQV
ncbi:MAG: hypothetical protein P4L92_10310 [Rudaea sp.]|nr:hypothetical protein [Rudaea sp.]